MKFVCFFATTEKLSIHIESLLFPIEKRDGHGKFRNGHGKVVKKYVLKCVRTQKMRLY